MEALPSSTMPPSSVTDLLDLLEKSGRSVQVIDPPAAVRAAWRRLIHALRSGGQMPAGWHLVHRGRDSGDLVLELRRGKHPSSRYMPARRAAPAIPDELRDPHPVVATLRDCPSRLPDSDENRSRTLLLLNALCAEAAVRRYSVRASREGLLTVVVDDQPFELLMWEESGARWKLRLVLELRGGDQEAKRWKDYSTKRLEEEFPAVLVEVGRRARMVRNRRDAADRADQERIQLEQDQLITDHRDRIMREQVAGWLLAEDIRVHCADLIAAGMQPDDRWLAWAQEQADLLDPLRDPPGMPPDPTPADVAPAGRAERPTHAASSSTQMERPWHPNRRWYHG